MSDNTFEFCGSISYETDDSSVGSDICMHGGKFGVEERQFLHDCLDEWLDKSNGTGSFWLGDVSDLTEEDDGELNKAMDRLERMTKHRDNLLGQRDNLLALCDELFAMCDRMMSNIDKQQMLIQEQQQMLNELLKEQ